MDTIVCVYGYACVSHEKYKVNKTDITQIGNDLMFAFHWNMESVDDISDKFL